MISQRKPLLFITLSCLTFLLFSSLSNAQNYGPYYGEIGPPKITDFSPKNIKQGATLLIKGENLVEDVQFTNILNQAISSTIGTVEDGNTQLTVVIPSSLPIGDYSITVTGQNGSDIIKTLSVSENKFYPPLYLTSDPPEILGADTFGELIGEIFNYSFQILGLIIFITFVWSGFMWLTARGNPGTIGKARSRMLSAVLGAILLLSSFLILNTINPDLVRSTFLIPGIRVESPAGVYVPGTTRSAAQDLITAIGIDNFSTNAGCGLNYHAQQNIQDIAAGRYPAVCQDKCTLFPEQTRCPAGGPNGNITVNPVILEGLTKLARERGLRFRVTSLTTGDHSPTSAHYGGNAVDIVPSGGSSVWIETRAALNSYGGKAICEVVGTGMNDPDCSPIGSGSGQVNHIHWLR